MQSAQGDRPRKPQVVVERVLARMRTGDWPPGTRLPSERELAAEFTVGRAAVREALQALQLSGHVETRVGEGSFAAEPRTFPGMSGDAGLVASMSITEARQAREAVELSSAVLASRRATRSDLLKLQAAVVELEELIDAGDYQSYLLSTLDLHVLVAKAAHNGYLVRAVTELTDLHRDDQWLIHERYDPQIASYSLAVHRDIVEAIVDKDAERSVEATLRHYEEYPVLSGARQEPTENRGAR